MFTFDPDARRARVSRPAGPIDGQLVCYYPCPRCSNPARALVYLGDAALASEVVAQTDDTARHPGLLAVGAGIALNGGHHSIEPPLPQELLSALSGPTSPMRWAARSSYQGYGLDESVGGGLALFIDGKFPAPSRERAFVVAPRRLSLFWGATPVWSAQGI
jgi:hypothetical protein